VDEDDFLIVIRPSDLATLRIVTVNLEMDGTKIRRSTSGETAAVIIFLPPQHFREHPQSATDDVLDLAAAAPTGLAFSLPDGTDEIELGGQSLLGLCEQLELAGRNAIAVPARATLMPLEATWRLSAAAEVMAGRGSLWRAKLAGPVRDGAIRARLQLVDVADSAQPAWDVLPSVADLRQRSGGVFEARRFDFSPIGVSARMRGPVDYGDLPVTPAQQALINSYEHDIDFGRDSRVRLVSQGHLSSGHAASLIRLRRRIFIGGSPDTGFAGVSLTMPMADLCGVVRLCTSADLDCRRVPGQRGDLNLHEAEQRERPQHLVQRVVGVDVEDADVAVAAHYPPQVQPHSLPLQVLCPLLLLGEEPGAFLLGQVPRDRDVHPDLEEHGVVLGVSGGGAGQGPAHLS
jgi:hypothetical protein